MKRMVCNTGAQWLALSGMLAMVLYCGSVFANNDAKLRDMATETCVLPGISVVPVAPWYSVPIEAGDAIVKGCQMIWEDKEQYMGIIRLMSFDLRQRSDELANWENVAISFEVRVLEDMNFSLGNRLWRRESLPVPGEVIRNAKAIAFGLKLNGVAHANEVHFILFEDSSYKYVLSLLTPSNEASADVYTKNAAAIGKIMSTIKPTDTGQ